MSFSRVLHEWWYIYSGWCSIPNFSSYSYSQLTSRVRSSASSTAARTESITVTGSASGKARNQQDRTQPRSKAAPTTGASRYAAVLPKDAAADLAAWLAKIPPETDDPVVCIFRSYAVPNEQWFPDCSERPFSPLSCLFFDCTAAGTFGLLNNSIVISSRRKRARIESWDLCSACMFCMGTNDQSNKYAIPQKYCVKKGLCTELLSTDPVSNVNERKVQVRLEKTPKKSSKKIQFCRLPGGIRARRGLELIVHCSLVHLAQTRWPCEGKKCDYHRHCRPTEEGYHFQSETTGWKIHRWIIKRDRIEKLWNNQRSALVVYCFNGEKRENVAFH